MTDPHAHLDTILNAGIAASEAAFQLSRAVTADNAVDLSVSSLAQLARQLRGVAMTLDTLATAATEARGEGPFGDRDDEVLANLLSMARDEADLTP